jgi:hypothetical protein
MHEDTDDAVFKREMQACKTFHLASPAQVVDGSGVPLL